MDGIRNWLVACGATFGCSEVHHYRWADAKARKEVPYITYRATRMVPEGKTIRGDQTSGITGEDPYTVLSESHGQFLVTLRVDLYNSEFGMRWLGACGVACEKEQAIINIKRRSNFGFRELVEIEDDTDEDDERIYYHQWMVVKVRTVITHTHKNYNHKVDSVDISDALTLE